jgi:hypothetical protein
LNQFPGFKSHVFLPFKLVLLPSRLKRNQVISLILLKYPIRKSASKARSKILCQGPKSSVQNPLDTQDPSSYTPAMKKQCLINLWLVRQLIPRPDRLRGSAASGRRVLPLMPQGISDKGGRCIYPISTTTLPRA